MEFYQPKYRRNPSQKIESLYSGVAGHNRTVTTVVRPSYDGNSMESTRVYGPGLAVGQGGRVGIFVLGGMETTLDEMEYILQAKQQKPFVPKRTSGEVAAMCRLLAERRNEAILARRKLERKNPSEAPKKRRTVRLHLPVGYRFVDTSEPGFRILKKV